jgi:hypothetical protein
MAFHASQIIGSPQVAGVTVLPRGTAKRQASATGGSLPAWRVRCAICVSRSLTAAIFAVRIACPGGVRP